MATRGHGRPLRPPRGPDPGVHPGRRYLPDQLHVPLARTGRRGPQVPLHRPIGCPGGRLSRLPGDRPSHCGVRLAGVVLPLGRPAYREPAHEGHHGPGTLGTRGFPVPGAVARLGQGPGRERDDRGPPAERPGKGGPVRQRPGGAPVRGGAVRDGLADDVDGGCTDPARGGSVRHLRGHVPVRVGDRSAEGQNHGDHRVPGSLSPGRLLRRHRVAGATRIGPAEGRVLGGHPHSRGGLPQRRGRVRRGRGSGTRVDRGPGVRGGDGQGSGPVTSQDAGDAARDDAMGARPWRLVAGPPPEPAPLLGALPGYDHPGGGDRRSPRWLVGRRAAPGSSAGVRGRVRHDRDVAPHSRPLGGGLGYR